MLVPGHSADPAIGLVGTSVSRPPHPACRSGIPRALAPARSSVWECAARGTNVHILHERRGAYRMYWVGQTFTLCEAYRGQIGMSTTA